MDKILSQDIIIHIEKEFKKSNFNCDSFYKELAKKYRALDIALIYNYILENNSNIKLLNKTIQEIKKNKYRQNFETLLNFIKKTDNIDLKTLAIKTTCIYKDTKAVPVLLECLQDKNSNYKIRFSAADALGKIGGKNTFEALTYVICDEEEKSSYVKESAVVALGNLGDNRAVDVFSSILSSKQIFLNKFSFLKERVIEAIAKLDVSRNSKAIDILKNSILDTNAQIRINSIEALMNLDTKESFELIYDRLKYDDDFEVKKNALIALYNLSDRKILDEVINGEYSFELKMSAKEIIDEYEEENE